MTIALLAVVSQPWTDGQRRSSLFDHFENKVELLTAAAFLFHLFYSGDSAVYMTLMRVSRLLNNEPLDEIAQAVRVSKSRISTLERFPHGTISPSLKRRIERHYGVSFDLLSRLVDGAAVVELLKEQVAQADRPEEVPSAV